MLTINKMKTIFEIKNQMAKRNNFPDWSTMIAAYIGLAETNDEYYEIIDDNINDAMLQYHYQFKESLPTNDSICEMALDIIPYTEDGNLEDDIDHAKRQLIIKGAKLIRDEIKEKY